MNTTTSVIQQRRQTIRRRGFVADQTDSHSHQEGQDAGNAREDSSNHDQDSPTHLDSRSREATVDERHQEGGYGNYKGSADTEEESVHQQHSRSNEGRMGKWTTEEVSPRLLKNVLQETVDSDNDSKTQETKESDRASCERAVIPPVTPPTPTSTTTSSTSDVTAAALLKFKKRYKKQR